MDSLGGFLPLTALPACEGCEQGREAKPASRIFTALMKSALPDSPHWTHANLACVLRLSADTRPHPPKDTGQVRLEFCGGPGYNRPPLHSVLDSSLRRSSNRLPARNARVNPAFW